MLRCKIRRCELLRKASIKVYALVFLRVLEDPFAHFPTRPKQTNLVETLDFSTTWNLDILLMIQKQHNTKIQYKNWVELKNLDGIIFGRPLDVVRALSGYSRRPCRDTRERNVDGMI